ncbi:MAG: PHP domain-containing protein [Gemmatimonadaceae bacterium]|nr:PHP domain-containing protein [Gemmatimonadaceae bacterium]
MTGGPAPLPFVDLHCHSTASDGALPPAAVVEEAHRKGLHALALTDHDTVAGLAEAQAAGERLGVRIVPGVELSAVENDVETHLLGLHLSDVGIMEQRLIALRDMRRTRAERMVERLNALGVPVTMEQVLANAAGGAIGRPHVARAVVTVGSAADMREAFDRYLGNGRPACVGKDRLSMRDAIGMVHEAGGIALLAHPGEAANRTRLVALAEQGLDGCEVRHPGHSDEAIGRIGRLVEDLGLLPSGGSDWHGTFDGWRTLGVMQVPLAWLERQDAHLAARRAGQRAVQAT